MLVIRRLLPSSPNTHQYMPTRANFATLAALYPAFA